MKKRTVKEILLPLREDVPRHPAVTVNDRISYAIELMVSNNLQSITVVLNNRPVGRICLGDALKQLGLRVPGNPPDL